MTEQTEALNCDHHYVTHVRSPLHVRICSLCGAPDWGDLAATQARLEAAERVCLSYGWSASSHNGTDREKATYMLWCRWHNIAPPDFLNPENHPELSDEAVAELARERDEIRERTLARFVAAGPRP